MEKAFDKQDLHRFFNNIKSKYVIPLPITNIDGKVTCRNGMEYIEKPYNNRTGIFVGTSKDFFPVNFTVNIVIFELLP